MKGIVIEGQLRTDLGKRHNKTLRADGSVPCVLYGGGENVHFYAAEVAVKNIIYNSHFTTADIQVEGKTYSAFIKEAQFHPVTDKVQHIDFQLLVPGHPVVTNLPVSLHGLAVGVKAGGKLLQKVRQVKVKAMPDKLVSEIKVDVTHLEVGKSVRIRDINYEGIQIMMSPAIPIASVEITRALRAAAAAAAAAATGAKGKKK